MDQISDKNAQKRAGKSQLKGPLWFRRRNISTPSVFHGPPDLCLKLDSNSGGSAKTISPIQKVDGEVQNTRKPTSSARSRNSAGTYRVESRLNSNALLNSPANTDDSNKSVAALHWERQHAIQSASYGTTPNQSISVSDPLLKMIGILSSDVSKSPVTDAFTVIYFLSFFCVSFFF
jgi:hypothetical protein